VIGYKLVGYVKQQRFQTVFLSLWFTAVLKRKSAMVLTYLDRNAI